MRVYVYSKCSTCQDALSYLEDKRLSFEKVEIVTTPPSMQELEAMLAFQNGNIKKLLNTSGMLYREMKLSQKLPEMTTAEILTLLNTNGMLVKRPFLLGKNFGLLGFKKSEWDLYLLNL